MSEKKDFEDDMNSAIVEAKKSELSVNRGIDIRGLEDVPPSVIPVPFVRLVQPTSQKVETKDGKEAQQGYFFFNDTKEAVESFNFALIRAKHGMVEYERDGVKTPTQKLAILGFDLINKKLFILSLSVMSFSNFGSLIAQMKQAKIEKAWSSEIIVKSEKTENEKGKFYIAKFELGSDLSKVDLKEIEDNYLSFGEVLDRKAEVPEEEITITQ